MPSTVQKKIREKKTKNRKLLDVACVINIEKKQKIVHMIKMSKKTDAK